MKKLLLGIAAAATLLTATPALAQVDFHFGGRGFGIDVGPRYRDHDRYWRDRDRDGCEVIIRRQMPDGSVVIHRENHCY
jgi:hypothetical protein